MLTATAANLLDHLRDIVGRDAILTSPSDLLVYECDGYTIEKNKPDVVVFPTSTEQVVQIVRACNAHDVPFLPRGAGTSLAGGCLPVGGGVMIGSEGTFGIATRAWVRITRNPQAYRTLLGVFETVDDATNTISDIIGAGILPGALEMLDQLILQAVEAAFHFGFPLDAGAVLIMEVDGLEAGLDADAERITAIAKKNKAREVRRASSDAERLLLWKCRKQAFGAVGRLAPR